MQLPLIAYMDLASNALPLGAGLLLRHPLRRERALLFVLILVGVLSELISGWMAFHHTSNLWILHIYNLIEFALLSLIFARWIEPRVVRRIFLASIPAYALLWLVTKWNIERFDAPAEYTHVVSAIFFSA